MPISSITPGQPSITTSQWLSASDEWLSVHGYPQHQPQPTPVEQVQLNTMIFGESLYGGKVKSAKPKSLNKIYNIPLWDAFRGSMHGSKQDGEIGLEIEAEGMNLFTTPISWWVTHPDGSLRAVKDHPPIEYVLRKPVSREDVPKALSYLTKKLKESGSSIVESHRTSVHVHVNCQDLTIKQIYQYWCMYTIFEEMLVDFSGPDRPGNLFCLSTKQAEYAVNCLEQAIQTENFNEVFSDNLRYTSCNTASLGKFGSLEFRSMRGTVDQGLIQVWVDLLVLLRDKALDYPCPRSIVEDYTRLGPDAFLMKTFSTRPDIRAIFLSRPLVERNKSMWEGLRLMKDVAYAITWDKRIPEDKKKEPQKLNLYEGYYDFQPVEMLDPEVWLMSNGEDYRVVNFSQEYVNTAWRHHTSLSFSHRRWWRVDEVTGNFLEGSENRGPINEGCYAPNE